MNSYVGTIDESFGFVTTLVEPTIAKKEVYWPLAFQDPVHSMQPTAGPAG